MSILRGRVKRNSNVKNLAAKRAKPAPLFALALMLLFSVAMPNQAMALWLFDQKDKSKEQSVLPASKVDLTKTQAIGDTPIGTGSTNPKSHENKTKVKELVNKRTAFTSTFLNKDGTKTLEYSFEQQNFKQGNKWEKINNKLDGNEKKPESNWFQEITNTVPDTIPATEFKANAGVVGVEMKPLAEGLEINANGKTFAMKPIGAKNVTPVKKDDRTVMYKDAWPHVDLEYEVRGELVKEIIVLKSSKAQTEFQFKVEGGKVVNHPTKVGELTIEGLPEEFAFSPLSLDVNERGVISEQRVTQSATGQGLKIAMDKDWLKTQTKDAFPMYIDPGFGRDATSYWMFKSDGYSCGANICYANTGTLLDGTWKHWRTYFQFPYGDLAGKKILGAHINGVFQHNKNGIGDGRWLNIGHANCISFHCTGTWVGNAHVGTNFDIGIAHELQNAVNAGNFGAVWSLWGEEGPYKSFKPYYNLRAYVSYDTPTPMTTPIEPANGQVTVNTQPTLRVYQVGDADGDAVQYYYRVSTNPDAETGAVINSGWVSTPQWTIPEGILQDGTTYYWHTYTLGATQTNPNWVNSFKVDLRTGKDSTQSYDTVGPIGIDLATGNATTSIQTHAMNALGGDIGLSLDYNTPTKAKQGLTGEYWNVSSGSTTPSGDAIVVRNDQDINFTWPNGSSPAPGINQDWFVGRWKGYFVAPSTGSYQFASSNDDAVSINVGGQSFGGCYGATPCYNGNSIALEAGQVVPINVQITEATGDAYMRLYVKGAVSERIVPRDWLRSEVAPSAAQYGLTGRYYTNDGTNTLPTNNADPMRTMMVRNDTNISFNWGDGAPASGLTAASFMAKWTGYLTVPTTGNYTLGKNSDDGVRIRVGNNSNLVLDSWSYTAGDVWGNQIWLEKGKAVPITVEYFDAGGPGSMYLKIKGEGLNAAGEGVPTKWLTPQAAVTPDAWKLGVDVDGDVSYERLRVAGNNVILEDSTRETHEYVGQPGGGFKPPLNEDGRLTRNADNSYTLIDVDGKTYVFDSEGKLTSLTTPSDDRKPASLKYEYAGEPSRLVRISDGVNDSRHGTLHYKSVNSTDELCPNPDPNPLVTNKFDAAPDGMLCAFKTSDGDVTRLYYKAGQLARVERPGDHKTDYGYDSLGRIEKIREPIANDAIASSVRTNEDDGTKTELSYDALGRAAAIKAPSPKVGDPRNNHLFEYSVGNTKLRIAGASEPSGFSKKVEYDSLLRTTRETDVAGLASQTKWDSVKDLQLSSTDATGMKSTTIYDGDDRPIENYGPAPAAWYGADRKPLAANAAGVPKTSTNYDEGINGPAVSYFAVPERASSVLSNGQTLYKGQDLWSTDGRFKFSYQADGNVVLYGPNGAIWNNGKAGVASDRLVMQGDGNLVQYNGGTAVWNAGSNGAGGAGRLVIQNDGNAMVVNDTNAYWSTNTGNWASTAGAGRTSLTGAPLLNTTGLGTNPAQVSNNWASSPVPSGSNYWGMRMTGKLYLPTTGNWKLRIVSDGGVRLSVNDQAGINDWQDGTSRSHPVYTLNNTAGPFTPQRLSIDYYHLGGANANFTLYITPPGGTETADVAQYIKPGYSLQTSQTAFDAEAGNVTSTTMYNNPAYGTVAKTSVDPTGLNLETQATYEAPGVGFLRQTSKALPGGSTTTYQHYSATDTRDNPCTNGTEAFRQAGRPKGKGEADPDGAGSQTGRSSETIYNESGDVVATRYNNDDWTCTTYDNRGRVVSTVVPAVDGRSGRTISNNYSVGNNPLITRTTDSSGSIIVENDLLGRTIKYTDTKGKETTNIYDQFGKLTSRTSPVGTESYEYDTYDRLTKHKLDGVTFATVTYDAFSRLQNVQYPAGISLSSIGRDTLQRENSTTFTVGDQTVTDSVNYYASGDIKNGTEHGVSKAYTYDKGGRLTGATIGGNTYAYSFGASDASCTGQPGNNVNAGRSGNRTKLTVNGQDTTYCYDQADRLISSSDATLTDAQYDSHGNTTSLGNTANKTEFGYDASDRNVKMSSGNNETTYTRDAQDRIIRRVVKQGGDTKTDVSYSFTGSGDSPDALLNTNGDAVQKYLTLPGDVVVSLKPGSTSAGAQTYSLPNIHGDITATVNADGMLTGKFLTGPFGEALPNQPPELTQGLAYPTGTTPQNTADGTSWSYVGQHQKLTDKETTPIAGGIIQMGARVYIPTLGRFLQTDPVDGAGDNAYSYVNDAVNENDLDGKIAPIVAFAAWQLGRIAVQQTVKIAAQHAAKQAAQQVAKKTAVQVSKKIVQKAAPKKAVIGTHARQQMQARGVTKAMVNKALQNGTRYLDKKHPGVNAYVLRNGMASGKNLYVAQNRLTGKITTVIVKKKFNPRTGRWMAY